MNTNSIVTVKHGGMLACHQQREMHTHTYTHARAQDNHRMVEEEWVVNGT